MEQAAITGTVGVAAGVFAADPAELAGEVGTDAVRWWLLRDVPRIGDADYTRARLVAWADGDLAGGFGKVVNGIVTMVHACRGGRVPEPAAGMEALAGVRLDSVLAALHRGCVALAEALVPFLPDAAARIAAQATPVGGLLPAARPLFPRIGE